MAKFSGNYPGKGGVQVCPLCQNHLDLQKFSFQCSRVKDNVKIQCTYSNIFSEKIEETTIKTLMDITKFREKYIEERTIALNGHGAPANPQVCSQLQCCVSTCNVMLT